MKNLKILEWTEEQFKNSRNQWNTLLDESNSDPLFLSWEWQHTWWKVFSDPKTMHLKLYVALDETDTLVGIAPLYLSTVKIKKLIPVRRLQFIGGCWRGMTTMRTELLSFITKKSISENIVKAFYQYINLQSCWDEFVLADTPVKSDTFQVLKHQKPLARSYYRIADKIDGYYLAINNSFDEYLKTLGKNTRLKLFNRRKILEECGLIKFEISCPDAIDEKFDLLNRLHAERWGGPVFTGNRLKFNKTVAHLMADNNNLIFSTLYVNGNPVSIQYNYIKNHHEYNIQAGFTESFHKKLALGYLHFGYAIEAAYKNNISVYDFLVGEGKNSQYKAHLTASSYELIDLQVVRKRTAKLLYYLYNIYIKIIKYTK